MNVLFLLGSLRDGSTNRTLAEDFRHINPKDARIVLVEAASHGAVEVEHPDHAVFRDDRHDQL